MKLKRRFGVVLLMAMLVMAMTVTASAAKKVKLNKKSATLSVGKTVTLRVKNAGSKKVTWASSNVNVAVVEDGVVTAVDAGKATIRATVGAKTLKCKVTVKAAAEQASVAIVGYSTFEPRLVLTGSAGEKEWWENTQAVDVIRGTTQYDLKPHVQTNPAGAALTWTSSNEKVATVKDGVVKAVADGTALITVTANGASDSIVVYVTGMGTDEETNPIVITMANYDRLFNKYFERVTRRTVFLDANGNILDPTSFREAWIMRNGQEVDITDDVKHFYHEDYYIVCKDSRVDTLRSSGIGNFQVWNVHNTLTTKEGGVPVLTPFAKVGSTDYALTLGSVKIPVGGDIPFTYAWEDYYPEDPSKAGGDYVRENQANGLCKVTLSDPSMADKEVLGFGPYRVSGDPTYKIETKEVTRPGKGTYTVIDKITYYTWSYEGESFREIRFTLYLK